MLQCGTHLHDLTYVSFSIITHYCFLPVPGQHTKTLAGSCDVTFSHSSRPLFMCFVSSCKVRSEMTLFKFPSRVSVLWHYLLIFSDLLFRVTLRIYSVATIMIFYYVLLFALNLHFLHLPLSCLWLAPCYLINTTERNHIFAEDASKSWNIGKPIIQRFFFFFL